MSSGKKIPVVPVLLRRADLYYNTVSGQSEGLSSPDSRQSHRKTRFQTQAASRAWRRTAVAFSRLSICN